MRTSRRSDPPPARRAGAVARAIPATAIALVLASAPAARGQGPERFTIAQALSAPFPTELVASPRGDAVAWLADNQGARNVWIARAPDWRGRQITSYTGDIGWELSAPRWLPDGSGVVFVRGEGRNHRGEYPNPALDPAGRDQLVMLARTDGAAPRALGEGHDPEVAPDGRSVAFLRNGAIWLVTLDSAPAAPARPFIGRGRDMNVRWSPDASAFAFTSRRGDHSFVGIFDVRARTLRYVDPSVDRDGFPIWSPDGRSVAFIRQPALTRVPVHAVMRSGMPWSIRVADARTGTGREIWRAAAGAGSVFWQLGGTRDQLVWTRNARIVFPWERGGWRRVYAVPVTGRGTADLLTPGDREVEGMTPTADRRGVVYVANEGTQVDLLHVWETGDTPGTARILTPGTGIQWLPAALTGGAVAMLASDARTPAHPVLLRSAPGTGAALAELAPGTIPRDFPSADLVVPEEVTFRSTDGLLLHGQLFRPTGGAARHAAIVFFHGGSRRQMLLGFNPMGYYHNAYALNQYLASRGYLVLSVNYRTGIGYGLDFREALHYGPGGGAEARDAIAAGRYLRSRADVDPARIGVWGGSYGGYMTALSLARDPEDYRVGVDFAGVHDWNLEWPHLVDTWDVDREQALRKEAYASSPMSDLSRWRAPVLLIQGDDDRNVVFSQTVQLAEDLRARGVHVETLVYPDETHEWLLHRHWVESYEATAAFLMRYLR